MRTNYIGVLYSKEAKTNVAASMEGFIDPASRCAYDDAMAKVLFVQPESGPFPEAGNEYETEWQGVRQVAPGAASQRGVP